MKPVILTRHARARMAQYQLTEAVVVATVRRPLWTCPDVRPGVERRFSQPPTLGGRFLRVACVVESDHIRVLSAFPDRDASPPDGA
jgi:hypothetical protein